jgi:transposase
MARLKPYHPEQGRLLPVVFDQQIQPGTFEFAVHHLVDEMDVTGLLARFRNDETGAPAYDPRALLKIVLVAYSRGILSSLALSADTRPHFTTIAQFVSSMGKEILGLFVQIVAVCSQQGLISREMFAVDGCKLSSNAAKEWSGTRADFEKRKKKLEEGIEVLVRKHREADVGESTGLTPSMKEREEKALEGVRQKLCKINEWLDTGEEKTGSRGKPRQSNLTDNESAKMPSSHGVVQGYNGVAMVDEKRQVIVHAEAFGEGAEQALLKPMIEGTRETFQAIGHEEDAFAGSVLVADSGYSSEANAKLVLEDETIEAYIPDTNFRKRDPAFANAHRYRRSVTRKPRRRGKRYFLPEDFRYDPDKGKLLCPGGQGALRQEPKLRLGGRPAGDRLRGQEDRLPNLPTTAEVSPKRQDRAPAGRQVHGSRAWETEDVPCADDRADRHRAGPSPLRPPDGDRRARLWKHAKLQENGSVHAQRKDQGGHPVEALRDGPQHREADAFRAAIRTGSHHGIKGQGERGDGTRRNKGPEVDRRARRPRRPRKRQVDRDAAAGTTEPIASS